MRVIELQESAPQAYRSHLVYYRDVVGHDPPLRGGIVCWAII